MTTVLALLLLVVIKFYLFKLPALQKFSNFDHIGGEKVYFSAITKLLSLLPKLPGAANSTLVVLPIMLLVILADNFFVWLLGLPGGVLFSVGILYYCLGNTKGTDTDDVLVVAHEKMFAIIFWFMLLGPAGAAFYWVLLNRNVIESNGIELDEKFNSCMITLHGLAAWIPARVTGLIYALVGNFITGYECWLSCMQVMSMQSSKVLSDCGMAALGKLDEDSIVLADETMTKDLVERAFIVWIIFSVIIALIIK